MYLKHLNVKIYWIIRYYILKLIYVILSDVFQKFSNFAYETYNLDPRHSHTLYLVFHGKVC